MIIIFLNTIRAYPCRGFLYFGLTFARIDIKAVTHWFLNRLKHNIPLLSIIIIWHLLSKYTPHIAHVEGVQHADTIGRSIREDNYYYRLNESDGAGTWTNTIIQSTLYCYLIPNFTSTHVFQLLKTSLIFKTSSK